MCIRDRVTVVEAMSIPVAHQIHTAWALPGGATAAEWAMTRNVQAFLTTIGDPGNTKDETVWVSATPVGGQTADRPAHELAVAVRRPGRVERRHEGGLGGIHLRNGPGFDHGTSLSHTTTADAMPASWDSDTCTDVMPSSARCFSIICSTSGEGIASRLPAL